MKLLYVSAGWCGVCRVKAPVVREFAEQAGLPLEMWDWDDEGVPARAGALRIRTPPTLALVDGDRVRFRLTGAMITPETAARLLDGARGASR